MVKGEKKSSVRSPEANAADVARRLLGALGGGATGVMSQMRPGRSFGEEAPPNGDDIESIESLEPLGDDDYDHVALPNELRRRPPRQQQQQQQRSQLLPQLQPGFQGGLEHHDECPGPEQQHQQQQHLAEDIYEGPLTQLPVGTAGRGSRGSISSFLHRKQLALGLGLVLLLLLFPLTAMVTSYGSTIKGATEQKNGMAAALTDLESSVSIALQEVVGIKQQLYSATGAHNATEMALQQQVDQMQAMFRASEDLLLSKMATMLQGRTPEAFAASQAELQATVAGLELELRKMQQASSAAVAPPAAYPKFKSADPETASSWTPFNLQRLEEVFGRVVPAKVVSHSPVLGEFSLQMVLFRSLSKILKGRQGYVNPKARHLAMDAEPSAGLFANALHANGPPACVAFHGPPASMDIAVLNSSHGLPPLSLVNITAVTLISTPSSSSKQVQRFRLWFSEVKAQAVSSSQSFKQAQADSSQPGEPGEPGAARWAVAGDFDFEHPSVASDVLSTGLSPRYCRTFILPQMVQVVAGSGGFVLEALPHANPSSDVVDEVSDSAPSAPVNPTPAATVCMPTIVLHGGERSM